jgi:hypothetical protein
VVEQFCQLAEFLDGLAEWFCQMAEFPGGLAEWFCQLAEGSAKRLGKPPMKRALRANHSNCFPY